MFDIKSVQFEKQLMIQTYYIWQNIYTPPSCEFATCLALIKILGKYFGIILSATAHLSLCLSLIAQLFRAVLCQQPEY